MRSCLITLAVAFGAGVCGCTQPDVEVRAYSERRIVDREWDEVFAAAHASMREYFRIDRADSQAGFIRSVPTEERRPPLDVELPVSTPLRSARLARKRAEIRLQPQRESILVRCAVAVQQSNPVNQLTFAPQYSIDDIPNRTPLQESEGLPTEGEVVWSTTGSDRKLERELLAAIAERLHITEE